MKKLLLAILTVLVTMAPFAGCIASSSLTSVLSSEYCTDAIPDTVTSPAIPKILTQPDVTDVPETETSMAEQTPETTDEPVMPEPQEVITTPTPCELGIHEYNRIETVLPQLNQQGYDIFECAVCGDTYFDNYTKALTSCDVGQHDDVVTRIEPTCTKNGSVITKCKDCGRTLTTELEKTKHNMQFQKTVPPTESSIGYDLYVCTECDTSEQRNKKDKLPKLEPWQKELCSMQDLRLPSVNDGALAGLLAETAYHYIDYEKAEAILVSRTEAAAFEKEIASKWQLLRICVIPYAETRGDNYNMRYLTASNRKDDIAIVTAWSDKVIKDLGINTSTTKEAALTKINDWLCDFMSYDYDTRSANVADATQTGTGICHVYAVLYQMLCRACGMDVRYESSDELNHAWDYIIFDDGTEKYIDVTWNDIPNRYHRYLLLDRDVFIQMHY